MKFELRHLKAALAVPCAMALSGCSLIPGYKPPIRLSDTPRFYAPRIDSPRAPKPDDAPMPVLVYPPKRKFIVLGTFRMRSKRYDFNFMTRAAIYNARKLGADAVLVRDRWYSTYNYIYYPNATSDTTTTPDPQSKKDRAAGKPQTYSTTTTYDQGPPEIGTGEKDYFYADIIIYK